MKHAKEIVLLFNGPFQSSVRLGMRQIEGTRHRNDDKLPEYQRKAHGILSSRKVALYAFSKKFVRRGVKRLF
jgi:hypothetical protein